MCPMLAGRAAAAQWPVDQPVGHHTTGAAAQAWQAKRVVGEPGLWEACCLPSLCSITPKHGPVRLDMHGVGEDRLLQ